ncbi:MAG: hypothetical protein EOO38_00890 [Cytophagaceae bacterium]|nr:MAG: hypothetical protein EOO38_00890 [Cytophagaceae bacterium]
MKSHKAKVICLHATYDETWVYAPFLRGANLFQYCKLCKSYRSQAKGEPWTRWQSAKAKTVRSAKRPEQRDG